MEKKGLTITFNKWFKISDWSRDYYFNMLKKIGQNLIIKNLYEKKILITGSAGFIAPHIAEQALNLGWQVIGVDTEEVEDKISDKRIKYIKSDLRDLNEDDIKDVDFVAHMAFVTNIPFSIQNPLSTTYDNIDMTAKLLDLCTKAKVKKFIFPSTAFYTVIIKYHG